MKSEMLVMAVDFSLSETLAVNHASRRWLMELLLNDYSNTLECSEREINE